MDKRSYLLIILVCIAIFALVYFLKWRDKTDQKPAEPVGVTKEEEKIAVVYLPKNELPEGITEEMILESKAEILESFMADIGKGVRQSTLQYSSKNNPGENYDLFLKYFLNNGWAIAGVNRGAQFVSLSVTKKLDQMNVTATTDLDKKIYTVSLTLVRNPGK